MSEDNEKDAKFFQNNPIYNPFAGPDDPLIERIEKEHMEEIDKLIKEGKLGTVTRVPPLFETPLPEHDSLMQPLMFKHLVTDNTLSYKVNTLEGEVAKLNSDIVHLKTVIFKLEMELQALKKNKEE